MFEVVGKKFAFWNSSEMVHGIKGQTVWCCTGMVSWYSVVNQVTGELNMSGSSSLGQTFSLMQEWRY